MFRSFRVRSARAAVLHASACAALCGSTGCAPRAGFSQVQAIVEQRMQADTEWHAGPPSPATRKRIEQLLSVKMSAEHAVQIALLQSRELQAAFSELEIARAALQTASLPPNPELEGRIGFSDEERPEYGFALTEHLSQLLYLPYRDGVAQAELEAERMRAAGAAIDLVFAVRRAFYEYQAGEQLLELWRTVLEAGEASYTIAERLAAAGNITRLELDSEQAFREEARVSVAAAEVNAVNLREELNRLIGVSGSAGARTWRRCATTG
jgi:outer membrane protein, heavy metal efflux system